MTVINSGVTAAPAGGTGKPAPAPMGKSTCLQACVHSKTVNTCGGFSTWKQVVKVDVTPKKGTTVNGALFDKKEWWSAPSPGQPAWFGGHVYDDGSMTQWIVGDINQSKAVKYQHTDYYVIFWQKGQEQCTAKHGTFKDYNTLSTVTVLASP